MALTDITSSYPWVKRGVLAGMGVLSVLLAACTTPVPNSPPTMAPTAAVSATPMVASQLADTTWVLVSLDGEDPLSGTEITLHIEGETLGGSAGCNTYGGSYALSDGGLLRVDDLYATEMACMAPEGVMAQEQAYLKALRTVTGYDIDEDKLTLVDGTGEPRLAFSSTEPSDTPRTEATASPIPDSDRTATPEPETSVGVRHVVDEASGVSLLVPADWTVIEPGPEGRVTIVQSYAEDKYVGGEPREPGDTKCDLTVHPMGTSVADLIGQVRSDSMTTILSEEEIDLKSGRTGTRMELNSLGPARALYAEIDGHAVAFICFGNLEPFDEVAVTLRDDAAPQ